MKKWVLPILRCPNCCSHLNAQVFEDNEQGEFWNGVLVCKDENCKSWYPIIYGIPRMVPPTLLGNKYFSFKKQFADNLNTLGLNEITNMIREDELAELKQETARTFGFEWSKYSRHGWDDPVFNIEHEEAVFQYKSMISLQELKGNLVLDAGCGNGRYTYQAAMNGGQVIGMDLGDGVEAAAENTKDLSDIQIIQGDIFFPPFADDTFNIIFSIGVLMHTGDAKRAFITLVSKLKCNGTISIHLYGKGNFIYESLDKEIRKRTTKMTIDQLGLFTERAYGMRRFMERIKAGEFITRFIRLDSHPHCIFDWYSAPIATHHSYEEVKKWFEQNGILILNTNEDKIRPRSFLHKNIRSILGRPLTVSVRGLKGQSEME